MRLTTRVKQAIYPLYIFSKNKLVKQRLSRLYHFYRQQANQNIFTNHKDHELRIYSNLDEDGILLWIIATLNIQKGYFIDIGSNDCINSNCANLAFNFDWDGVFIDADAKLLSIGKKNYSLFGKTQKNKLQFVHSFVTAESINKIIGGFQPREVDFVSIDIDGNDFEIFEALEIKPKLFVVENKVEYGRNDIAITGRTHDEIPHFLLGASPYTMTKQAETKGYSLVAANKFGFNLFYLRNDLVSSLLPKIDLEHVFSDPLVYKAFYSDERITRLFAETPRHR